MRQTVDSGGTEIVENRRESPKLPLEEASGGFLRARVREAPGDSRRFSTISAPPESIV